MQGSIVLEIKKKFKMQDEDILIIQKQKAYLISADYIAYHPFNTLLEKEEKLVLTKEVIKSIDPKDQIYYQEGQIIIQSKYITKYFQVPDINIELPEVPRNLEFKKIYLDGIIWAAGLNIDIDNFKVSPNPFNIDISFIIPKGFKGFYDAALLKDYLLLKENDLYYFIKVDIMPDTAQKRVKKFKAKVRQLEAELRNQETSKQKVNLLNWLKVEK